MFFPEHNKYLLSLSIYDVCVGWNLMVTIQTKFDIMFDTAYPSLYAADMLLDADCRHVHWLQQLSDCQSRQKGWFWNLSKRVVLGPFCLPIICMSFAALFTRCNTPFLALLWFPYSQMFWWCVGSYELQKPNLKSIHSQLKCYVINRLEQRQKKHASAKYLLSPKTSLVLRQDVWIPMLVFLVRYFFYK